MNIDLAELMKSGMRRLTSGVSVISLRNRSQERFAMTASSVTSVSDAPPSLLVCVNQSAQICAELVRGQIFAVNVLSQNQQNVSKQCSGLIKGEARFSVGDWQDQFGTPLLQGAEVNFVCVVDAVMAYGTHHVVVGKLTDVLVATHPLDPLVYLDGAYRKIQL